MTPPRHLHWGLRSSRRGTFLLMCMALVATLTVLAFAFLRTVQTAHTSGDATTRNLLAREAALDGFQHAGEDLMRGYISDPINPLGPGFTRLDNQAIAPFLCINGPYSSRAGGSGGNGTAVTNMDHDDVSPEDHLWDPLTLPWLDFEGICFSNGATSNDGCGRYYEPSFYNFAATTPAATFPTIAVPFTNLALTSLPDRADGLFLDEHFVRIPSSIPVLQARQQARFRLRYAVDIIDLDSCFLVNGDPGLDYTKITDTDPNNIADPVAKRVAANMEAIPNMWTFVTWTGGGGYDTGSSGPLRYQHVYQGRGWASNFDLSPATPNTPLTFPLMYRATDTPWYFLSGGWSSTRPNPGPGFAPELYTANGTSMNKESGPRGLKEGGEVWPATTSIAMNHVMLGPTYSFHNARVATPGTLTDYNGDGGAGLSTGVEITPFQQNVLAARLPGSGECVAGSPELIGSGSNFTQTLEPGAVVSLGSQVRIVQSRSSDTEATMTTPFTITASGAAMALVSRSGGAANSPMCLNIFTASVNVVNGLLQGYVPRGVMKQQWYSGSPTVDYATLFAYMTVVQPKTATQAAVYTVSSLSNIDPPPLPPSVAARVTHSLGDYYYSGGPCYYQPVALRFSGGGAATEASATVACDANTGAIDLSTLTIINPGYYSSTPTVTCVMNYEADATWDLFIPALSKAFGPGYGDYTQPQSTDADGTIISPDFHVAADRPADPRPAIQFPAFPPAPAPNTNPNPNNSPGLPYPAHPTADPGYRTPGNRYPGPLAANGFDADDNPCHDHLGRFIDVSDQTQVPDPYTGGQYPGDYYFRVCGVGPCEIQKPTPALPGPFPGRMPPEWGITPYVEGGNFGNDVAPDPDSFYADMLCAMANAIAVARAQWLQCTPASSGMNPASLFVINNATVPWNTPTNNNRVENLHDLDALFLANLGIDINNPSAPVIYTGPVNFTAGPAPRPGGWINYSSRILHHLPAYNIAMLYNNPLFTQIINGANLLNDGSNANLNGTTATSAQLTQTMEMMLNDFRMSFLGSSPGYQATFQALDFNGDGRVCCSAFPSAATAAATATMAAYIPNSVDTRNYPQAAIASATEAALHIDQLVDATEIPFGSTTATGGAVTISADPAYIPFCISGNFDIGKSRFYRVIVRGALWDNLRCVPLTQVQLESVLCLDPAEEAQEYSVPGAQHPGRQYSSHVIYQRWFYDKYRGSMSRSY